MLVLVVSVGLKRDLGVVRRPCLSLLLRDYLETWWGVLGSGRSLFVLVV